MGYLQNTSVDEVSGMYISPMESLPFADRHINNIY